MYFKFEYIFDAKSTLKTIFQILNFDSLNLNINRNSILDESWLYGHKLWYYQNKFFIVITSVVV